MQLFNKHTFKMPKTLYHIYIHSHSQFISKSSKSIVVIIPFYTKIKMISTHISESESL